ncbi:hypothetical protein [Mycoplasma hafezii]|uniref:hypothetical protein n=1 Tax=Mycoplasma hafezii TaxID=525886 RepID=UPI003CEC3795
MKYKLKKTFLALTLTMSAAPLLFGVKIESNIKQTHKTELLDFLNANHKEFIKENQAKINESFLKLKNSEEIKTLIDNLDEYTSDKSFINYIDNLNLDLFTKKVILIEFKRFQKREKFKHREIKTGKTWYKLNYKDDNNSTNNLNKIDIKINNESLRYKGFDIFEITDNVFAQDESYIGWSNQTIMNVMLGRYFESNEYLSDLEKAIDLTGDDLSDVTLNLNKIMTSRFPKNSEIYWFLKQNELQLSTKTNITIYKEQATHIWKIFKVLKNTSFETIKQSGGVFNFLKATFKNKWTEMMQNPQIKLFLSEISDLQNLITSKLNTTWFQQLKSVISKSLVAISVAFFAKSITELIQTAETDYVNVKALYDTLISGTNLAIGAVSLLGTSIPVAGAIISLGVVACDLIMKSVKLGNGYTIYQNFNDQGLNDWEFQWKENHINMLSIAIKHSNNFKNGIVWKVTDGWFSYPDLFIAQAKKVNGRYDYKNYQYQLLSPGNEFNFGNKIK